MSIQKKSKRILITQSNYIPWKGYFDAISQVDEFIVYDDMQFTKRDWRNRNLIKTPNGLHWLTIPVEVKGKYFQKINEVAISDSSWGKKHWNSIVHNYSKAIFFDMYRKQFEDFFLHVDELNLSSVNFLLLQLLNSVLNIKTPLRWSSDFNLTEGKTTRLLDICKISSATDYFTGPSAKNYLDESLFNEAGIKVHYFNFNRYPKYSQLFGEFEHGVTVLDLIFNVGPEMEKYFKGFCV